MFGEGVLQRSSSNIPQTGGAIPTPTSEGFSIRTERNANDRGRVFGEDVLHRPRCNIPQIDLIPSPTSEGFSIRTERNANDIARVFSEGVLHRPRCNIPQIDPIRTPTTCERRPIWTERNATDRARVVCQQGTRLIRLCIVEPHTEITRNRQQRAIGRIREFIYSAFAQAQFRSLG